MTNHAGTAGTVSRESGRSHSGAILGSWQASAVHRRPAPPSDGTIGAVAIPDGLGNAVATDRTDAKSAGVSRQAHVTGRPINKAHQERWHKLVLEALGTHKRPLEPVMDDIGIISSTGLKRILTRMRRLGLVGYDPWLRCYFAAVVVNP